MGMLLRQGDADPNVWSNYTFADNLFQDIPLLSGPLMKDVLTQTCQENQCEASGNTSEQSPEQCPPFAVQNTVPVPIDNTTSLWLATMQFISSFWTHRIWLVVVNRPEVQEIDLSLFSMYEILVNELLAVMCCASAVIYLLSLGPYLARIVSTAFFIFYVLNAWYVFTNLSPLAMLKEHGFKIYQYGKFRFVVPPKATPSLHPEDIPEVKACIRRQRFVSL